MAIQRRKINMKNKNKQKKQIIIIINTKRITTRRMSMTMTSGNQGDYFLHFCEHREEKENIHKASV